MKKALMIIAVMCLCPFIQAQQLYNMSLDEWSKKGSSWNSFPKGATEEQRVWDRANRGMKVLGINTTMPELDYFEIK